MMNFESNHTTLNHTTVNNNNMNHNSKTPVKVGNIELTAIRHG